MAGTKFDCYCRRIALSQTLSAEAMERRFGRLNDAARLHAELVRPGGPSEMAICDANPLDAGPSTRPGLRKRWSGPERGQEQ